MECDMMYKQIAMEVYRNVTITSAKHERSRQDTF